MTPTLRLILEAARFFFGCLALVACVVALYLILNPGGAR